MSYDIIFDKLEGKTQDPDDISERIVIFAPMPKSEPDDGILEYDYFTVEKHLRFEMGLGTDFMVVFVSNESQDDLDALTVLLENATVFNIKPFVLKGLPDVEYEHWFNSLLWSAGIVSYRDVISEASVEKEIAIKGLLDTTSKFHDQQVDTEKKSGHVRSLESDLDDELPDGEIDA